MKKVWKSFTSEYIAEHRLKCLVCQDLAIGYYLDRNFEAVPLCGIHKEQQK